MRFKLLFISLLCSAVLFARPQTRAVIIDTVCNAPMQKMLSTSNKFCYQFQACPDSLFSWAYLGIDKPQENVPQTKESRNAIQLIYKERIYDPKLKTGDVTLDIYVLGVRWWKDQHLGTKYVVTRPANAPTPLTSHMTATYSGSILEGAHYQIRMEPISENQTRIHYEFSLTFGKVLSAFISDKMWKNAIEWRFETILENLIEYTETGKVEYREHGPKQ